MPDNNTCEDSNQEQSYLIPLIGKRGQGLFAVVDIELYDELCQYRWRLVKGGYVGREEYIDGQRFTTLMHRQIMNTPKEMDTDHRDGNPLNNLVSNLRICTTEQNTRNRRKSQKQEFSSQFIGVSLDKNTGLWNANIGFEGRRINLGNYETEVYAARVRDGAAIELFREFAGPRNLPDLEPVTYTYKEKRTPGSSYIGVSYHKRTGKWMAYYCVDYKQTQVGLYLSEIDAARARDGALLLLFGEKAERQVPDMSPIFQKPNEYYGLWASKYKGVSWHKNHKKWEAGIMVDKKRKFLGSFDDEIEAARAYDKAAKSLLGENVKLNFQEAV